MATADPPERRGKSRSVLVTGGSGFIGRHLIAVLRDRGDMVRVLDLRPPPDDAECEFIEGSIIDRDTVRRALDGIDVVFHLAAISHLWIPDPDDYERVNVGGTWQLLSLASERRVARFVHCSTEAVLFPRRGSTRTELSVADMPGPYSRSKFMAEQAALRAARNGLPVVIVNPTIPIGAGDRNFTAPTAMLSMLLRHPPRFVLDFMMNLVDVRDAATGIMLASERGRIGERYILGGENIMMGDIVRRVGELSGHVTRTYPIPGPVALIAAMIAAWIADTVTRRPPLATPEGVRLALRSIPLDSSKARNELGYSPGDISEALAQTIAWLGDQAAPPQG